MKRIEDLLKKKSTSKEMDSSIRKLSVNSFQKFKSRDLQQKTEVKNRFVKPHSFGEFFSNE